MKIGIAQPRLAKGRSWETYRGQGDPQDGDYLAEFLSYAIKNELDMLVFPAGFPFYGKRFGPLEGRDPAEPRNVGAAASVLQQLRTEEAAKAEAKAPALIAGGVLFDEEETLGDLAFLVDDCDLQPSYRRSLACQEGDGEHFPELGVPALGVSPTQQVSWRHNGWTIVPRISVDVFWRDYGGTAADGSEGALAQLEAYARHELGEFRAPQQLVVVPSAAINPGGTAWQRSLRGLAIRSGAFVVFANSAGLLDHAGGGRSRILRPDGTTLDQQAPDARGLLVAELDSTNPGASTARWHAIP